MAYAEETLGLEDPPQQVAEEALETKGKQRPKETQGRKDPPPQVAEEALKAERQRPITSQVNSLHMDARTPAPARLAG